MQLYKLLNQMVTKTYLKLTYLPTYLTVVTVVKENKLWGEN